MTRRVSKKPVNAKKQKVEKLEFVQDFLPIKNLSNGIIETVDGRYIKILEIEPINFLLRSDEEQMNIISSFASWLKISPMRLQIKSITRKADSDKQMVFVGVGILNSPYLGWDYSDPETAVLGVAFHSFEWLFVRVAPIIFIAAIIGIFFTFKKE